MILYRDGLAALDREACLGRLGSNGAGRVAVTTGALPAIFPVNYAMWGDNVVFRTPTGTTLEAALRNAVVAFEVDDNNTTCGWSVLVVGLCREITDPAELAQTDRLPVTRWAIFGGAESTVCLRSDLVSGRAVDQPAPPEADTTDDGGSCAGRLSRNGYSPAASRAGLG